MPAKSPEALANKRAARKARMKAKRAPPIIVPAPIIVKRSRKWHIGPPAPNMSKAELRAMLALACANTAVLS